MMRIVVIADDPAAVRANRFALRYAEEFRVVATLDGRGSVRARIAELQPDVVLVNEMRQRTNVVARILEVRRVAPDCRVLLLTSRTDARAVADAVEAGADLVVHSGRPPGALAALLGAPVEERAPRPAGDAALRLVGPHSVSAARTSA